MTNEEMEKLLARVYKEIDIFDFNGKNVPRIILDDRKFDDIMSKIQGKPVSVNTNLNILQDGLGHVFVEIMLDFSYGEIHEEFLVYANESLEFLSLWRIQPCLLCLRQIILKLTKTKFSWFSYQSQIKP